MSRNHTSNLAIVALSLFLVTFAVNLEVPLYFEYTKYIKNAQSLSATLFSAYVIGLLPVVILFGGLCDYLGRKHTIMLSLTIATLASFIIIENQSFPALFLSRLLKGISVGLILSSSAVFLSDLIDGTERSANVHGIIVASGLGGGALATSIAVGFWKTNPPITYSITTALLAICLGLSTLLRDNRAQITNNPFRTFLITAGSWTYCLLLCVAWSLVGVFISVISREIGATHDGIRTGLIVFLSTSTGALFQPACRKWPPGKSLFIGFMILVFAYFCLLIAIENSSELLLLVASALVGTSCLGFIFIGGLTIVMRANTEKKARVVSGYFMSGYIGLGIPCILVGYMVDTMGLSSSILTYGVVCLFVSLLPLFINHRKKLLQRLSHHR